MFLISIVLVVGLCPMFASSIVYNLNGTLGPNLNGGPDCLSGNGAAATAAATASSTQKPTKTTSTSATYSLPAGAVTAAVGSITFTSTAAWTMKFSLSSKADTLTLSGPGPLGSTVTAVSSMKAGSLPKSVISATGHPAPIAKPDSPQNLTSPASYLSYSVGSSCPITKLGFTGTIASTPQ
jgi:hypothetical protein